MKTPNPSSKKRNLRKQPTFRNPTTVSPAKYRLRERAQKFHADLRVSACYSSCRKGNLLQTIKSGSLIWVLTRYQYGIFFSDFISQRNHQRGGSKTGPGRRRKSSEPTISAVAKYRLFSQATTYKKCKSLFNLSLTQTVEIKTQFHI